MPYLNAVAVKFASTIGGLKVHIPNTNPAPTSVVTLITKKGLREFQECSTLRQILFYKHIVHWNLNYHQLGTWCKDAGAVTLCYHQHFFHIKPIASFVWRSFGPVWRHKLPPSGILHEKKVDHQFQPSARALIATSCLALHWYCFLLRFTLQHWLFFPHL